MHYLTQGISQRERLFTFPDRFESRLLGSATLTGTLVQVLSLCVFATEGKIPGNF